MTVRKTAEKEVPGKPTPERPAGSTPTPLKAARAAAKVPAKNPSAAPSAAAHARSSGSAEMHVSTSQAAPVQQPKTPKLKKPKPVRDSFTMPKAEYELIDLLKRRAHAKGIKVKKSELLRAGILALANMPDAQLFAAIAAVPVIKTGRPSARSTIEQPEAESARPAARGGRKT